MKLDIQFCVEATVKPNLPVVEGSYEESKGLLFYTIYGNYVLGTFRKSIYNIPYFYPASESKPYPIKEVVWWAELPENGGILPNLHTPLSSK